MEESQAYFSEETGTVENSLERMEAAATESSSRRSLHVADSSVHSFSERPDRTRTPNSQSLQVLEH